MTQRDYGLITSLDELARHCDRMLAGGLPIAIDIETGYHGADKEKWAIHPETAFIVGISFTDNPLRARYVPLAHDTGENLDNAAVARLFWPICVSGRVLAHNISFELRHMARWFMEHLADDPEYGEQVRATAGYWPGRSDTQVEGHLRAEFNAGTQTIVGLKPLVLRTFGHQMMNITELFPGLTAKQLKALRFNPLDPTDPKVFNYACEDSAWSLALHQRNYPHVKDMGLFRVEMYIATKVLPEMEDYGVGYSWAEMRHAADELKVFRDRFNAEVMAELSEMAGETIAINLASPPQVGKVLYTTLGLRTTVYTPTTKDKPRAERKMSTGTIALTKLADQHTVVRRILQWREQTKLLGTYLEKYEKAYRYADDGRAHPSHLSAYVVTGRFACTDPNYQQSPKTYHFDLDAAKLVHKEHAAEHGPKCTCTEFEPEPGTCFTFNFRDMIVAPPGHYILGFDLSQAELRAIAGEARETALLRAFEAGEDVHTLTAALMLGKRVEEVTKEDRAIGKTMNFALLYGMGVKSLADRLGLEIEQAQLLYDKYFAAYPNIAAWSARQVRLGHEQGYVTSRFERKLPIWEFVDARDKHVKAHGDDCRCDAREFRWIMQKGERACVNYPIQGGATGDYVKIAMVRAHQAIHDAGLADRVHLVMNIHDALEFYVDKDLNPQEVINVLQPAVIFPVAGWPGMHADWHIARSWGSPHDITIEPDGTVTAQGRRLDDIRPLIEVDEETGEEIEVLPEVDREHLAAIVSAAAPEELTTVTVTLTAMPDAERWRRFTGYAIDEHPGGRTLRIDTPEGVFDMADGTGIGAGDSAEVRAILGPCTVSEASSVDPELLGDGLMFT